MSKDCKCERKMNMFPTVQEPIISDDNYIDTVERYQYQYPIIMRYLKNKINDWNVGDFLYEQGAHKLVLYAITEFTELVIEDLKRCEKPIKIASICDKNNQKYIDGFQKYKVIGIDELVAGYESKKFDKILICSIFHANEIFTGLMERKIKLEDMISVSTAIFNGRENNKC
jgi:hypothetical protein